MLRKIWAIGIKEARQVRRDPIILTMLLGVPAAMLLLFGYALNFDVRHAALAVEDRSRSQASRALIEAFVRSTYFDLVLDLGNNGRGASRPGGASALAHARTAAHEDRGPAPPGGSYPAPGDDVYSRIFERRMARAVLVIPEDFASELSAGRVAVVQLVLDGADANTATTVLGYASALVTEQNVRLLASTMGASGRSFAPPIDYQPRVFWNPELKSARFLVPGLIGFILMITGVLSTALSVVREKERGTMEQLRVTALRPLELVLGKVIPYLLLSLAATVVILAVARALFGVAVAGAYTDLFAVTFIYLVGALAFGLLISSVVGSQALAFQGGALLSMLPAIFLSGFVFPIRSMPAWLQAITYLVPARYYLNVARGVILKGAGLGAFGRDMAFLTVYATLTLGVSFVRLSRREK